MLQPASAGGEPTGSDGGPGVIWMQDGLERAVFTSRRILGRGLSFEAMHCEDRHNENQSQMKDFSGSTGGLGIN